MKFITSSSVRMQRNERKQILNQVDLIGVGNTIKNIFFSKNQILFSYIFIHFHTELKSLFSFRMLIGLSLPQHIAKSGIFNYFFLFIPSSLSTLLALVFAPSINFFLSSLLTRISRTATEIRCKCFRVTLWNLLMTELFVSSWYKSNKQNVILQNLNVLSDPFWECFFFPPVVTNSVFHPYLSSANILCQHPLKSPSVTKICAP